MKSEQVISFIQTKSLKYWLYWFITGTALLWVVSLAFTYTIAQITVTYHNGIKDQAVIFSAAEGRETEQAFSIGEIAFLKRDTNALIVSAGSYQTDKSIGSLPIIGIPEIKVGIFKDRDARKYSGDNIGCTAYDKQSDTVLSYNCGNPANLVRYDRPLDGRQWQNFITGTMKDDASPINSVKPFKNGVLGITIEIEPRPPFKPLFYVDGKGTRQHFNLPEDIDFTQWSDLNVVTDQASVDSSRFLLVHRNGTLYMGELEGSSVTYHKITLPSNYNNLFDSLNCRLLDATVYCYYGQGGYARTDSEAEAEHIKKNPGGTIFVTSPSGTKQYKVSGDNGVDDLFVTRSKQLYALHDRENIYKIDLKDDRAEFKLLSQGIQTVGGGDGVIYIKGNAVFKVDDTTQESYLLFKSNHLRLSNVILFGDDIFVNAYINDTLPSKLHTYKLSTESSELKTGERLVDKMPYYIPNVLLDMDYADNVIRIRVNTSNIVNKARNQLIFDPEEYEKNREDILSSLSEKGISPDTYNIIFSR